ncbi:MAG: dTMP kinase, partial [Gammaproteobacteria bacterium]
MSRGAFLTVEGSDGAGKTTQLEFIHSWLGSKGVDVVRTREPGGTAVGEKLRDLLLNQSDLTISDETELLLIFAARQQHLQELILPALEQGKWVLCDRFTDATYA